MLAASMLANMRCQPAAMSQQVIHYHPGQSHSAQSGPAGDLVGGAAAALQAAPWMASMMPPPSLTAIMRAAAAAAVALRTLLSGEAAHSGQGSSRPASLIGNRQQSWP